MKDTLARILAFLGLLLGGLGFAGFGPGGNDPVDLTAYQLKLASGVDVSSAGATPAIILNAESTGIPVIKGVNAAGTEVWKITDGGVFIGPAHGGTPTP